MFDYCFSKVSYVVSPSGRQLCAQGGSPHWDRMAAAFTTQSHPGDRRTPMYRNFSHKEDNSKSTNLDPFSMAKGNI